MGKSALKTNETLSVGEYLVSENRAFYAVLQADANFCVYAGTGPGDQRASVWCAAQVAQPIGKYFAIMQGDGKFCIYEGTGRQDQGRFIWGTKTEPASGAYVLYLVNSGELSVYAGTKMIWRTPTDKTKTPPLSRAELEEAIRRYGPLLYFHPDERYFLTTVDSYLAQCTLHDDKTGSRKRSPQASDLPTGQRDGNRFWLEVPESAKGGDLNGARAYVHAKHDINHDYTDIQFWLFSAYNGPGTAFLKTSMFGAEVSRGNANVAPLGEHYSDWEYVSLRFSHSNKRPVGVFLSQHGGGFRLDDLLQFERFNDQVVVYVSKNGHANYPRMSENFSEYRSYGEQRVGTYTEFMLRNDTAKGRTFDCAKHYEIVAADCIEPASTPPPWLDYPYRWGPISATTRMTPEALRSILGAAFGVLGTLFSFTFLGELAALLVTTFVQDDKNGVVGPKQHGPSWNGDE